MTFQAGSLVAARGREWVVLPESTDDFLVLRRGRTVHVLNAPSPAATASLEIGRHISSVASVLAS